ncbi:archaellin/type IV pilin N-terminal domain-containing protein [Halobacteriaceae archaeon GCM10025711]
MSPIELFKDRERGQVGIETLIIFIAMILVAAVAAGVLINTAGFLQNKASATSTDSTEQVSNQVIVVSAIGVVDDTSTNVTTLNLTVMESPGAEEIDLEDATLEWIGPKGHTTLVHSDSKLINGTAATPGTNNTFYTSGVKDLDDSNPVLNSKDDRIVITVNLNATEQGTDALSELQEGEKATVKIVTQSGSLYTYVVNVPESLSSSKGSSVEV